MTATVTKLTGQALLDYVDSHPLDSHTENCVATGYVKHHKDGAMGCDYVAYFEAILDARKANGEYQEPQQSGADWYDNLTDTQQELYDQIEEMCPEFAKFTAEECQEFMNELSDLGITTADEFENAYYMQFDSYKAEREFAEELMCQVTPNLEDSPVFFAIDWQRVWDHSLSYDFSTIEFDSTTYFFHNN